MCGRNKVLVDTTQASLVKQVSHSIAGGDWNVVHDELQKAIYQGRFQTGATEQYTCTWDTQGV